MSLSPVSNVMPMSAINSFRGQRPSFGPSGLLVKTRSEKGLKGKDFSQAFTQKILRLHCKLKTALSATDPSLIISSNGLIWNTKRSISLYFSTHSLPLELQFRFQRLVSKAYSRSLMIISHIKMRIFKPQLKIRIVRDPI